MAPGFSRLVDCAMLAFPLADPRAHVLPFSGAMVPGAPFEMPILAASSASLSLFVAYLNLNSPEPSSKY